mmetsp:Transcript_52873/g.114307  ORF Transcript_52873/g.114307 Transcript_52873/m.114307 type:complete len:474 (+) Transcript_52873:164-1585(+)
MLGAWVGQRRSRRVGPLLWRWAPRRSAVRGRPAREISRPAARDVGPGPTRRLWWPCPRCSLGRRWLSLWGWPRELQLGSLVARVYAPLPFPTIFLRQLNKIGDRLVFRQLGVEESRRFVELDCILDQLDEVSGRLHVKDLQGEGLLEIRIVVEGQVVLPETRAVWIIEVLLEGMQKKVQLIAHVQQRPVLVDEVGKEGLPIPQVQDIIHRCNVNVLRIDVRRTGILLLFLGDQRLPPHRILPLTQPLLPVREGLLPGGELLFEPLAWLQILHPLGLLLFEDPVLEKLFAACLLLPDKADLVKALLPGREAEASEGLGQGLLREVWNLRFSVEEFLLLFRQLHDHILILFGLRLLFLLLGLILILILRTVNSALSPPLFRLLRLLPLPLEELLPLLLLSAFLLLRLGLGHLVRQHPRLDRVLIVLARLTHEDRGLFLEVRAAEHLKGGAAIRGNQIRPQLSDNVVALHQGHDRI